MLSKEEIYKDHYMKTLASEESVMVRAILPAMDEYAKQEAIGFGEFILKNAYSILHWLGNIYFTDGSGIENYKTPSQLYQQYLQTK